jgi:2,4-didehydro-3-deoxy-L-rhamnonate hydrolase
MRIANAGGRLCLVDDHHALDVESASDGRFAADPQAVFARWEEFREWAVSQEPARGIPLRPELLGPPVPRPGQVFGIGLNYRDHAREADLDIPEEPMVFTKFPSCITSAHAEVVLPSDTVDHEIELVVAIAQGGHNIAREQGWEHVAGLTVGQDISDRFIQLRGSAAQFSMGKSFPGFGPTGPVLITPDELPDRDRVPLRCAVDGVVVQEGTTEDLIFDIPELIARLSAIVTLLPGDLIFTGTPAGVGAVQSPPRFLQAGQLLTSEIPGLCEMTNRMVRA